MNDQDKDTRATPPPASPPAAGPGVAVSRPPRPPSRESLRYAFFNIINPLIAIAFGFLGFRVEHQERPKGPSEREGPTKEPRAQLVGSP